ncbi:MAG TPA: Trp biosynthesis-associated membrane protein [Streptosporangiaceae bacterium]|nr:Trp biosynthesis-associated membrane protein [Streptosporangiaceae bacterium]
MRRQFGLILLLGAAGAALVVFAVRQTWARAVFTPPHPLPAQEISVTGQQLVPLAGALALAALACLAAVIATRSAARRVAGALLAVLGAAAAVAAGTGIRASNVLTTAQADAAAGALGGSTTGGASSGGASHAVVIAGSPGHALVTGASWQAAAIVGAAAIVLAGLATVWRGPRWPVMSARFERPGQQQRPRAADSATMWESLSRDLDPTASEDPVRGGPPG